ncbi:MAG: Gfo/Idh/MocA family oxidoreductase [Candidatus Calescibacterium sp.]|nr:Gfo/Idh/MocA family oxidoreductase [Candidatus Calescibacterium sp.]
MGEYVLSQIGLGHWGENIFRNLLKIIEENNKITSLLVFDKNGDRIKYIFTKYSDQIDKLNKLGKSIVPVIDIEELKKGDAVIIATPASTHYEIAKKFIEMGKNVFVEKLLALRTEHATELRELSEKKKCILMVGHLLLYHPAVIKLKQIIKDQTLGKLYYIYSNILNLGKLRTEENILWSFAPHDISVILYLLERDPITVTAFQGSYITPNISDITLTILDFPEEIKAHIFVSWLNPFKEHKMTIIGSKGMIVFDDISEEKLFLYNHRIEWHNGIPVVQKAEYQTIEIEKSEPLYNEIKHFIYCIENDQTPLTSAHEAIRVLRVIEKAEESIKKNKTVSYQDFEKDPDYFVHESSYIDENVKIGKNTKIWHFCHILRNTEIGENVIIGQNVMIGPDVKIGNNCKIQNNVSVYKGVTLEDDVFCGPSCVFTNVYNPRAFIERKNEFRPTVVKRGATIGANATIICGVTIGEYAFIGAGAVVNRDVPPHALVVGVPARQIGWVCKCGTTLKFQDNQATCKYCNRTYLLQENQIRET